MIADDPDAELLSRIGRGDARAVRTLVERKLPRLLALAVRLLGRRAEAEEIAQEALLRAWRQVPAWRTGEARFDTWLHGVALNLCRDRLRRQRDDEPYDDALHAVADPAPGAAERLHAAERSARVAAALGRLPPRQREAVVLQYYQGLSNDEAAALMGVGVEALESLLARGRRALRARLAGEGSDLR